MAQDLTRTATNAISTASAGRGWRPPPWLAAWSPAEPVPVPAGEISAALAATASALVPIEARRLLVELDRTLAPFGLPANWQEIAPVYLEALEDVPADLVERALKHVRLNFRYGFPKPADLRAPIAEELADRRTAKLRLETARDQARPAEPPREPPTPAQIAAVREKVLEATRAARTTIIPPAPRAPSRPRRTPPELDGFALVAEDDPRVQEAFRGA